MGVDHTVIEEGDKVNYPKAGDNIVMSYVGRLTNGDEFDSNESFPCQIGVGALIKGWDVGVLKMSLGEKAVLKISPDYGYGSRGFGKIIPPNSELVFDVQLKEIKK